ncbi:hypothetical protein AGMMS4957_15340 [Bacteroidia bacterium]|nr:hypothetical protein AGMMS4957_15340 [Bacteroidia bacterium]
MITMKKVILIMAVALSAATVSAQGLKFGVTAGLNLSTFSGDGTDDLKFTPGFQAGVVVDYALTESFSIAPELLFAQRGAKEERNGGSQTMTLNYLQLPINATYKLALGDSKLLVFAGPYVGYGLSGTAKWEGGGESGSNDIKFGSDEMFKALDFGLNIGAGYQIGSIYAKVQYNLGLANISNDDDDSLKNGNIGISVGYLF